jgi:hypothetical protein
MAIVQDKNVQYWEWGKKEMSFLTSFMILHNRASKKNSRHLQHAFESFLYLVHENFKEINQVDCEFKFI